MALLAAFSSRSRCPLGLETTRRHLGATLAPRFGVFGWGSDARFRAKTSSFGWPREGLFLAVDQALENGDKRVVVVGDVDGVAGELGIRGELAGFGAQGAGTDGLHIGDADVDADGDFAVGIGGGGEREVGERENGPALDAAHGVQVMGVDRHLGDGMARRGGEQFDAGEFGVLVLGEDLFDVLHESSL